MCKDHSQWYSKLDAFGLTRMLPPVSVPRAKSTKPAATATPAPLEEPPGILSGATGLMGASCWVLSPEMLKHLRKMRQAQNVWISTGPKERRGSFPSIDWAEETWKAAAQP